MDLTFKYEKEKVVEQLGRTPYTKKSTSVQEYRLIIGVKRNGVDPQYVRIEVLRFGIRWIKNFKFFHTIIIRRKSHVPHSENSSSQTLQGGAMSPSNFSKVIRSWLCPCSSCYTSIGTKVNHVNFLFLSIYKQNSLENSEFYSPNLFLYCVWIDPKKIENIFTNSNNFS